MNKYSDVIDIHKGIDTMEGGGVYIRRYIGYKPNYFDPFLLLDEIKNDKPEEYQKGFPIHPHAGFEVITYLVSGKIVHSDSTGSRSEISSGDIQFMNTGSGVVHSEMPIATDNKLLWGFQLWINIPSNLRESEPYYKNYHQITLRENDIEVNIIAGKYGNISQNNYSKQLSKYISVRSLGKSTFNIDINEEHNGFIVVSEGRIDVNGSDVGEGMIALLNTGKVEVLMEPDTFILFVEGRMLKEQFVRYGPFVMDDEEGVLKAIRNYRRISQQL
ncbi:MAG: pirin family protein [Spirochaetia bacterium]|nr:pirin family protein [Spirochaetota bacterium]MDW8111995.1 pirin family protein [Spirochaetia bacterium]